MKDCHFSAEASEPARWPPRRLHPSTSDRIYTEEEREFLAGISEYQQRTGRRFPTWCEVLGVIKSLGYRRLSFESEGLNQGIAAIGRAPQPVE
jgi:hypothetical protein